jgi:signal transduction histidine kinase
MNASPPDAETVRLRRLLDIQDRERTLIAYEIHDGLSQYITGAVLHLESCRPGELPDAVAAEVDEALRLLRQAAAEARRLMSGLRPPVLEAGGLGEALATLVASAREDIPAATLAFSLDGIQLPPWLETTIFRVVQESLTNARRHAAAGRVDVSVAPIDGGLRVQVSDDGRGFDPDGVPSGRLGLEGIRQRVLLTGGHATITSRPGEGTLVEVVLPIAGGSSGRLADRVE